MKRLCFICDGSGWICGTCGESARACTCKNASDERFDECDDCGGTGVASADRTGGEPKKERPE